MHVFALKFTRKAYIQGVYVLMEKNISKIFNPKTSKCITFRGFCIKKVYLEVFELNTGKMKILSEFSEFSVLCFSFDFFCQKIDFLVNNLNILITQKIQN